MTKHLLCLYCGREWEDRLFFGEVPPCPDCKERKHIKVCKDAMRHNKYYEDVDGSAGYSGDYKIIDIEEK